ncbi:transglycosylase domain-containing protein [Pseudaestuariivita atlantica]|uniref:peptidoglycan glycosyltransferase n=1 Tax=Pseudaestuariivita atlantica TaxID=1317121 RepID=A0A0L1JSJ9_9RHOB|nr:PBP1A family penicillin-binding protein [Pseudaestuariivita atlantica]KNG94716.1 glycosyl transferase [Pseudaestuariivita atlantica]
MSESKGRKPRLVADRRYSASKPKAARKTRRRPKKRTARKGGIRGWLLAVLMWPVRLLWRLTLAGTAIVAVLVGLAVFYYASTIPDYDTLLDGRARGSVTLLDRNGRTFAWRGDQFGGAIAVSQVSPHLKNAVIATEDKRFYRHFGVSPRGVASAMRINVREGRGPLSGHGGSTITQQVAKLLCLGQPFDPAIWASEAKYEAECRRTTLWRKVKEAAYALALETRFTKDEILGIYLNRAFLGSGARGFEAASKRYFGKSAQLVNAPEAAMLAGLLVAPTRYAPTNDLDRSRSRANLVLGLMEDQGYLTKAEADTARANPAVLSQAAEARAGGAFADWVVSSGPEFFTRNTTDDVFIQTTLDPAVQRAAEEALSYVFENRVREGSEAQAAIVVMSADGAVRAMVGGRQLRSAGGFNRATQANRQTGSSFKPFIYALAMQEGYSPLDFVRDEPYTINVPGSGPYTPSNYDNKFHGRITLTEALAQSYNIPAVKISEGLGRDKVREIGRNFGLSGPLVDSPSVALGASESTLLEMTGAYAGILNGGSSVTPYGLVELRLQGESEPLMGTTGGIGPRVIREDAAQKLVWMMYQAVETGTGTRARLDDRQVAGKTGTTQAARDAWFIGFTADYVAGVWMGYDDNTPLTGVTGGGLPAAIWRETMVRVHAGVPPRPLPMIVPETPASRAAEAQRQPTRRQQVKRETVLRQVLRDLLGQN